MAVSDPRVLVGFAESLAAVETTWSLQEAGFAVTAFARRNRRSALRRLHDVETIDITAPEVDAGQAIRELDALCQKIRPIAVMPLDDIGIWLTDSALLSNSLVAGPTGFQARFALDKRLQITLAARAGLSVPPTRVVRSDVEIGSLSKFPLVLKAAEVLGLHDGAIRRSPSYICGNQRELEAVRARWDGSLLLAQPLLAGKGYGVFGLATDDGVHAWSAHQRIRMMNPTGSGSSACSSARVESGLVASIEKLLADIGWQGLFMTEFLRDEHGRAWFMELNGRPWGSMALARRAGLEYPAWTVRSAVDPAFTVPEADAQADIVCRHLGREIVHVLTVFRGRRSSASAWPSRRSTLRDVLRIQGSDRWYNTRPGNRALLFYDAFRTVADELRRS